MITELSTEQYMVIPQAVVLRCHEWLKNEEQTLLEGGGVRACEAATDVQSFFSRNLSTQVFILGPTEDLRDEHRQGACKGLLSELATQIGARVIDTDDAEALRFFARRASYAQAV